MVVWYYIIMGRIPQVMSKSVEKYGLGYIRPYHREIARRLVLGETQQEICEALGMTPGRMSLIVNSPLFKLEVSKLEKMREQGVYDISQQLQEIAPAALETIERIMYTGSDGMKFKAASDLLNRAGFNMVQMIAVAHGEVDTSDMQDHELIDLIKTRIINKMQTKTQEQEELEKAQKVVLSFDEVDTEEEKQNKIHILELD